MPSLRLAPANQGAIVIPEQVGDDHGQFSRDYGDAIQLLIECGRGKFSIAAAHAWLAPPIALQQIRFDRGRGGRALGFMTWAHVDDDTLARLRADKVSLLELPEWNEGEHLWIVLSLIHI